MRQRDIEGKKWAMRVRGLMNFGAHRLSEQGRKGLVRHGDDYHISDRFVGPVFLMGNTRSDFTKPESSW